MGNSHHKTLLYFFKNNLSNGQTIGRLTDYYKQKNSLKQEHHRGQPTFIRFSQEKPWLSPPMIPRLEIGILEKFIFDDFDGHSVHFILDLGLEKR